jgi:hypothetical protein
LQRSSLKERYEDLASDFAQNAGREQELASAFSHFFGVKNSDRNGGDTNAHE